MHLSLGTISFYLSRVKQIANVFEEVLVFNLSIGKEESRMKIGGSCTF